MLTDADCKNATCPADKAKTRKTDAGGLFLEVTPNGAKRWFWRYRQGDKVRDMAIGHYCKPGSKTVVMGLKDARAARDAARQTRQAGTDPIQQRQLDQTAAATLNATTFEAVAREFHQVKADGWSPAHAAKWLRTSENHLFPHLGTLPLASITAPSLLAVLRKSEAKGILSTVQDLRAMTGQVFRYGIQTGRCERNPAGDLVGALKPHVAVNFAAVLDPIKAGELLRAMAGYTGQPTTRAALLLSALLFQRPGNVRAMQWAWIDADAALLSIPSVEMKRTLQAKAIGKPHLVPLSRQALALLEGLRPLTGHGQYVFPSARTGERPMSDGTLNAALRRLDYGGDEMTAHGFRSMARTIIAERVQGVPADVVEAQLAHGKSGPLGAAYDRAEYMEQRRAMMQTWADYLDQLRAGAQVLPLRAA